MMSDNENEKRETLAAIVAEWEEAIRNAGSTEACLREAIRQIKCLNDMRPHDGLGYEINDVIEVANSIKGKNGNAAAMREALEKIYTCVDDCYNYDPESKLDEVIGIADAALSTPARNCDLYDNKTDAETSFVEETGEDDSAQHYWQMFANWLLAPAAERKGEGDGHK